MKKLLFVSLLLLVAQFTNAQSAVLGDTALKFNKRYTQCERKWVILPKKDSEQSYYFGFIYIDEQAGFTYDSKGEFKIGADGKYIIDTSVSKNTSIKYRIARNWTHVAVIDPKRIAEMGLSSQPSWAKNYYTYTDTLKHNFRWGFIYNDLDQCDTALIYLNKAYKVSPHYPGLEFEMIYAYNALQQYDNAITVIQSAMQNDPKNVLFYRELGYAYFHKKIYEKAIEYFTQGINMCSDKELETKSEMAINMAAVYKLKGDDISYKEWGQKAKQWATPGTEVYKFIVGQGF